LPIWTATVFAGFLDPDTVAVQDFRHLVRRQKQIGAAIVRNQKTETVPVSLAGSCDELRVVADLQPALGVVAHLAIAFHGLEAADEAGGQRDGGAGGIGQRLWGKGFACFAEGFQHPFPGGDIRVEVRGKTVCRRGGSVAVIVVVGSLFQSLFASKKNVVYSSVFAERRAQKRSGSAKTI